MSSDRIYSSWDWREISYGNDLLTIPQPQPGVYYVTVYAASQAAYYVTGGKSGSTHWLMAGVAISQTLDKGAHGRLSCDSGEE